jgi:hypothetical protein
VGDESRMARSEVVDEDGAIGIVTFKVKGSGSKFSLLEKEVGEDEADEVEISREFR